MLIFLVIGMILMSGCTRLPVETTNLPVTGPTPVPSAAPNLTKVLKPSQNYSQVTLVIKPETRPATSAFGFSMDYPVGWNYSQAHVDDWMAGYNFSSPDGRSLVFVYMASESRSAEHLDPLNTWANTTIRDLVQSYCHDGAGNRIACTSTEPGSAYHHPVLVSNDRVTIPGSTEARRLVFTSYDDPAYGKRTVYLMYAGKMTGYKFTVPGHYEVATKVTGQDWDYGMGGLRYMIIQYAPGSQVNATSAIFRHMIQSFKVVK